MGSNPESTYSLSPAAQARLDEAKAQIGFATYRAYLEFYQPGCPGLRRLHRHLQSGSEVLGIASRWQGSVLSLTGASGLSLHEYSCTDTQGAGIVEALCNPPDDTQLQIVLWNIENSWDCAWCDTLIDFLGLVLKLDPRVFEAVLASAKGAQTLGWPDGDRYHPTHATIGGIVATVCDVPHQSSTIPVVLVIGRLQSHSTVHPYENEPESFDSFACEWMNISGLDRIRPSPPFKSAQRPPAVELDWPCYRNPYRILLTEMIQKYSNICSYYRRLLRWISGNKRDHNKRDHDRDDLYDVHVKLRHLTDQTKNDWRSFVKFMRFRKLYRWFKDQLYRELEAEIQELLAEANGLGSHIRDDIQLEAGKLGLEESRKSNEMSNKQIQEAERVKIFTILAFFYVPLNLAASIFRINLQQLNGNGKSLQDFIGTSLVALVITGGLWFSIEQVNHYQYWHSNHDGKVQAAKPSYSMGERIAMVVWLLRHRKHGWMWRSGAWWRIPFNNDAKMIQDPQVDMLLSVTDYVSKYSQRAIHSHVVFSDPPGGPGPGYFVPFAERYIVKSEPARCSAGVGSCLVATD